MVYISPPLVFSSSRLLLLSHFMTNSLLDTLIVHASNDEQKTWMISCILEPSNHHDLIRFAIKYKKFVLLDILLENGIDAVSDDYIYAIMSKSCFLSLWRHNVLCKSYMVDMFHREYPKVLPPRSHNLLLESEGYIYDKEKIRWHISTVHS